MILPGEAAHPELWFLARRRTEMPRKSYKSEEIVEKLRQGDVLTSQGKNVGEAIHSLDVSEVTY
jgi:hypothetical protein